MEKIPSLKVEKALGEKAIIALKALGIINPNLKVDREELYLHIPLKRKPQKKEMERLRTTLPRFEILQHEFVERVEFQPKFVDLLSEKLPPHLLSSLSQAIDFVGDIAIVEIPPELKNCKTIVGEAILRAHKRLNTVLAKSGAVGGEFRVREFEPIAGVSKTTTIHREYGCVFHVDLAKAYFSPRLSYEHNRVASLVREGETVLDMFTGVGPFAVHIARKRQKVRVYAVDKNPEAIRLLKKNMIANRVGTKITPILGDAEQVVAERLQDLSDRVIMNLPEKAIEYVDAACEAIKPFGGILHYYEFTSEAEPIRAVQERLESALKQSRRKLDEILSSKIVRGTAPHTWQVVVDARIK